MRVSASEKLESIRLVEDSSLSVRCTLAEIGLPRSTFYTWYKRYLGGARRRSKTERHALAPVWNRILNRMRCYLGGVTGGLRATWA